MKKSFTNKETVKKLASYSALAGAFVLVNSGASAQVVYTDVVPDETIGTGDSYDLDMNNDGDVDFTINMTSLTIPSLFYTVAYHSVYYDAVINFMKIYPTSGNAVNAYTLSTASGGTVGYGYALNNGENIGPTANMLDNSTQYLGAYLGILDYPGPGDIYSFSSFGEWPTKADKYLGVRFNAADGDHYGWVRITCDNLEITISDYAYAGTPDATIGAGDLPTAVQTLLADDQLSAYSFGNTINVIVKDIKSTSASVSVFNLAGQKVYQDGLNLNGMQITLNDVATGNYTLQVTTADNSTFSKQLYIQN